MYVRWMVNALDDRGLLITNGLELGSGNTVYEDHAVYAVVYRQALIRAGAGLQ